MSDIPLDEVVHFDVVTHTTAGAVSDADSTPTFDVYEEATDTGLLGATNFTKRTSLTGNYRGTFTASAANGFEAGKWYSIIASATVGSTAGKCVCKSFRIAPAESSAGVPKVDVSHVLGDGQSATDLKDFADAGYDPATNKVQGVVLTDTLTTYTGNTPQTGDNFARLGAPAGASIAADIAAVESQTDDIGTAGAGLTAVPWNAAWDAEVQSEVQDAIEVNNLDHLVKAAVDTNFATTVHLDSVIGHLADAGTTATFDRTADSLEILSDEVNGIQTDTEDIQSRLPAALTANGNMKSSLMEIIATALTETSGLLAGGFKKFFNVATPTGTVNSLPDAVPQAAGGLITSTAGSFNVDTQLNTKLNHIYSGTYSDSSTIAAGATSSVFGTGLTVQDGAYNQQTIKLTSGALIGECRPISTYVQASGTITLAEPFSSAPANGVSFVIIPTHVHPISEIQSGLATTVNVSAVETDTQDIQSRLPTALTANGNMKSSLLEIITTALTEGATGRIAAAWQLMYNVASSVFTTASVNQTGDGFARLGAPAGASVSADIAAVQADLPQRITKNTALANFEFTMVDSTDHVTGKTGLTITATRSLDGASFASCANSATEVSNGVYKIDLAAGDLNGNTVTLKFAGTGADTRIVHIVTQPT